MARIRTIKPELFKHDKLFDAEIESGLPLRTAFMGMLTVCDREGRFRWNPRRLKIEILPYDTLEFTDVLNALMDSGFIKHYIVEGEEYGYMPTFTRHQFINNKELDSEYPEYKDEYSVGYVPTTESLREVIPSVTGDSHVDNTIITGDSHVDIPSVTGKGKDQGEREGKEREREQEQEQENKTLVAAATVADADQSVDQKVVKVKKKPGELKAEITEVFEHWQEVMSHPSARLDSDRTKRVTKTLNDGYTVQQIKEAISGCKKTDFNMGQNDRNQIYDGLNVILKNADNIDRFIKNNRQITKPPTTDRDHRNDQVCDDFIRQMTGGNYQDSMTTAEGQIYEHSKH